MTRIVETTEYILNISSNMGTELTYFYEDRNHNRMTVVASILEVNKLHTIALGQVCRAASDLRKNDALSNRHCFINKWTLNLALLIDDDVLCRHLVDGIARICSDLESGLRWLDPVTAALDRRFLLEDVAVAVLHCPCGGYGCWCNFLIDVLIGFFSWLVWICYLLPCIFVRVHPIYVEVECVLIVFVPLDASFCHKIHLCHMKRWLSGYVWGEICIHACIGKYVVPMSDMQKNMWSMQPPQREQVRAVARVLTHLG